MAQEARIAWPKPVLISLDPPRSVAPRRRLFGMFVAALATTALALAMWNFYWLIDSTESGRELLADLGERARAILSVLG
jgi:hypothetical protein